MRKEEVVVSIVIPVFNSGKWLKNVIDNVMSQTFTKYEVILINDGSTDDSPDICEEAARLDQRFTVKHIQNSGPGNARNIGLMAARGRYIRFIDSDDGLDALSMQKMVDTIEGSSDIDLVIGRFTSDRNLKQTNMIGEKTPEDMITDMASEPFGFFYGALWNKLYRRSIIKINRIKFRTDILWCEDYLFNIQYYNCIKKNIYYLDHEIYHYIKRNDSLVSKVELKSRNQIERMCIHALKKLIAENSWKELPEVNMKLLKAEAYIRHSWMCNLMRNIISYTEFCLQCMSPEDLLFWREYKAKYKAGKPNTGCSHRIICTLQTANRGRTLYTFIYLKELFKRMFKND